VADRKISDLTALTTPATGDLIPIVDISEAAAADKNKSITVGELLRGAPDGTAAAPGFAFESDGGNGMFLGGTDILAFSTGGTQAVTIDASQRVGLGTSSPSSYSGSSNNLVIADSGDAGITIRSGSANGGNIYFSDGTTGTELFQGIINYNHTNDSLGVYVNYGGSSNPRLLIDSSGNVGIGTTSPGSLGELLHVVGKARFQEAAASGAIALIGADATAAYFDTGTYGLPQPIAFRLEGDEKARIDSSGRLLVGATLARTNIAPNNGPRQQLSGTTNETSALFICQNIASSSWGGSIWLAKNEGADGTNTAVASSRALGRVSFAGNDGTSSFVEGARIEGVNDQTSAWASGDCPGRLVFSTNAGSPDTSPTERMRITSAGQVFVGTTTGSLSSNGIILGNSGDLFCSISSGNTYHLYSNTSSSYKFYVNENGGISNYSANNQNLSDEREKKNIETLDSTWDCLKAWELKKFHYNEDADTDDKRYGVIAQQVAPHCPEVISQWIKQPAQDAELDDDGNVVTPATEEVTRMGVKEQQMMWMAIKALQEAQTRIETLEAEVAALKGA